MWICAARREERWNYMKTRAHGQGFENIALITDGRFSGGT
jgi:dihydroxyacid dehydratase/phosphogluconate dehydratase